MQSMNVDSMVVGYIQNEHMSMSTVSHACIEGRSYTGHSTSSSNRQKIVVYNNFTASTISNLAIYTLNVGHTCNLIHYSIINQYPMHMFHCIEWRAQVLKLPTYLPNLPNLPT